MATVDTGLRLLHHGEKGPDEHTVWREMIGPASPTSSGTPDARIDRFREDQFVTLPNEALSELEERYCVITPRDSDQPTRPWARSPSGARRPDDRR
ncbi:hypothetical protein [Haloarcula rubra]|uniref:hypothetical protein n=1 Tax=Haloarcula rubra TaxID=2487747 RepID=UPI001C72E8D9|nr:hypothetical protein [Halomicroarcula rubra]